MIALEIRRLAGGEVLHACPQYALDAVALYHLLSRFYLVEAGVQLLRRGAVGSRVSGHYARMHRNMVHCHEGDERGRMQRFWPIYCKILPNFRPLREAVIGQGWVEGRGLAVAGASMGGMTALGIMTHHPI